MERYDVVIVGAGPSGLTAAYCLAQHGAHVVVIERSPKVGGLMRGIIRGDFQLDLGRKVLNPRFSIVNDLWMQLLGPDHRPYDHRVGTLYNKRILEMRSEYKGPGRGMTTSQILHMGTSALWSQIRPGCRQVRNMEDYYVLRYGRSYFEVFVDGFTRKFTGYEPIQLQPPRGVAEMPRFAILHRRKKSRTNTFVESRHKWLHPARGTQQLVDAMFYRAVAGGIEFRLSTEVSAINVRNGRLVSVQVHENGVVRTLHTKYAIVSFPLPIVLKLLCPPPPDELRTPPRGEISFNKFTALVYLMAEGEPRFPHNWLQVTDQRYSVGRIVNYGTWNGDMVPPGKTALCFEYFALEGEPLTALSKDELLKLALTEAMQNNLIDETRITDQLVIQLPKVNAATTLENWRTPWTKKALAYVGTIGGLMETNRPGIDQASLAGIHAAEACMTHGPMSTVSLEDAPDSE